MTIIGVNITGPPAAFYPHLNTDELEWLGSQPTDILLVPLQGHSHIIQIAYNYVKALQAKVAIPNHQDNFFPPISTMVNPRPFAERVKQTNPNTDVRILDINETVTS